MCNSTDTLNGENGQNSRAEETQDFFAKAEDWATRLKEEEELLSKLNCRNGRSYMAKREYELIDDIQCRLKLFGKLFQGADWEATFDLSGRDFTTLGYMLKEMGESLASIICEAKIVEVK